MHTWIVYPGMMAPLVTHVAQAVGHASGEYELRKAGRVDNIAVAAGLCLAAGHIVLRLRRSIELGTISYSLDIVPQASVVYMYIQ